MYWNDKVENYYLVTFGSGEVVTNLFYDRENNNTLTAEFWSCDYATVSPSDEITYQVFTPYVIKDLYDLKKVLNSKKSVCVNQEGGLLITVGDDMCLDLETELEELMDLIRGDCIGTMSKENTCSLQEFTNLTGIC